MRTCGVAVCGVLASLCLGSALAQDGGFYIGLEARVQKAPLSAEKAWQVVPGMGYMDVKPYLDEAEGRNSITAFRFGYVQELSMDLKLDASLALGSVDPATAAKFTPPGEEHIQTGGYFDSAMYFDISVGVEGSAGALSYTGGFRYESSSVDEDVDKDAWGTDTSELEQSCIVLEGTVGSTVEDVRYFVGAGLNFYSGEVVEKDSSGVKTGDYEFEYDSPFVVFIGLESKTEKVDAFLRISLLGEAFLSTWAGAAVKF